MFVSNLNKPFTVHCSSPCCHLTWPTCVHGVGWIGSGLSWAACNINEPEEGDQCQVHNKVAENKDIILWDFQIENDPLCYLMQNMFLLVPYERVITCNSQK